jgi:hypothetical protein
VWTKTWPLLACAAVVVGWTAPVAQAQPWINGRWYPPQAGIPGMPSQGVVDPFDPSFGAACDPFGRRGLSGWSRDPIHDSLRDLWPPEVLDQTFDRGLVDPHHPTTVIDSVLGRGRSMGLRFGPGGPTWPDERRPLSRLGDSNPTFARAPSYAPPVVPSPGVAAPPGSQAWPAAVLGLVLLVGAGAVACRLAEGRRRS